MHPALTDVVVRLHRERLLAEAGDQRLRAGAARIPRVPLAARLASRRRALGYRLVEIGLRLALDRARPRPRPVDLRETVSPDSLLVSRPASEVHPWRRRPGPLAPRPGPGGARGDPYWVTGQRRRGRA